MKKVAIIICGIILSGLYSLCHSQNIAINTTGNAPNTAAILDIGDGTAAAGGDTKGLLIPRVALTSTSSNAPIGASVTASLLVYNSATTGDVTPGFYYWDGSAWVKLVSTGTSIDAHCFTCDGF